jgi:hypothetical protein
MWKASDADAGKRLSLSPHACTALLLRQNVTRKTRHASSSSGFRKKDAVEARRFFKGESLIELFLTWRVGTGRAFLASNSRFV